MITIDQLNKLSQEDFVRSLGGVYELSPWVAEKAWKQHPFPDGESLIKAMRRVVDGAETGRKVKLLKSHPDLAGNLAIEDRLTEESKGEQKGLGLNRLSSEDFSSLSDLNKRYRARFDFPFIVCVRHLKDIPELLSIFRRRIKNNESEERRTALNEVHAIAELRLTDLVE